MAKLTWSLSKIIDCNNVDITSNGWIHLNNTSGDKNVSPYVSVDAATSPNDCSTAKIFINLSNGEEEIINVSRCVPECKCSSITFTPYAHTVSQGGGSVRLGTCVVGDCGEYVSIATDGAVLCNAIIGADGTITATANPNQSQSSRTGFYKLLFKGELCGDVINVTQAGKPASQCANMSCSSSSISVTPSSFNFDQNGGSGSFSISTNSCWPKIDISSNSNWITVGDNNISVSKNESQISPRTGYVTITFYNSERGEFCYRQITINQTYTPKCDCETVLPAYGANTIPSSGISDTSTIAYIYYRGDTSSCTDLNLSTAIRYDGTQSDWIHGNLVGKDYKGTVDENTTFSKRKAYFDVYLNGSLCTTGIITQRGSEKPLCGCNNVTFTIAGNNNISWEGGDNIALAQYSETHNENTCDVDNFACVFLYNGGADKNPTKWIKGLYKEIISREVGQDGNITTRGGIYATVLKNDSDIDRSFDFGFAVNGKELCNLIGSTTVKQNKRVEGEYDLNVDIYITNNNYMGVLYTGNKYGFELHKIVFVCDDGDIEIPQANLLIKGDTTRENVSISSSYLNKTFNEINLIGSNGNGEMTVVTECNNCGDKNFYDDAEYYITMN